MSTPLVVVQCTASDLLSSGYQRKQDGGLVDEDAASYAVAALRDAALAPVVLAAPDLPENRAAIPELARRWGVEAFLGAEFDTVARLLDAAAAAGADTIARVVMASFYVEPQIVRGQLAQLEACGADYCALPRDFNINFGADVVRVDALRRVPEMIERLPAALRATARYRPWPFLELDAERFAVTTYEGVPAIGAERVGWIRDQLNWPERAGPGFEGGEYEALAADVVTPGDAVLDAGCGHGQITSILGRHADTVVGIDHDADMIAFARQRFPQIEFEAADLQRWSRPSSFDVIFHAHTLEHCSDAVGTLTNLRVSLKPGGRLIVEVPLALRPGIINPHHEREYSVAMLSDELERAGLAIREPRGVCRGIYGPPETARESFLAICTSAGQSGDGG